MSQQDAIERLIAYRRDLALFGRDNLRLRDKAGDTRPFVLNTTQLALHQQLEQMLAEKGWVRALVLKGRQQGVSTYVGARYYQKTSLHKGRNTYILAHEQAAATNLFNIVDRYQRYNPLAPHVSTSNIKELVFDRLDSTYAVATAGSKEGGRGRSMTYFHGSEVAFWNNAPAHFAASVQSVPLLPGTEVILETTSAGPSGEFYERWMDAEAGKGDYVPIFLPWFLESTNVREPEFGFELETDPIADGELSEVEVAEMFDLSLPQMAWRRAKIAELRDYRLFKREYPADVSEAWSKTDDDTLIPPLLAMRARKRQRQGYGPKIIGVDPAGGGGDRFAIAMRQGLSCPWIKHRSKVDTLEGAEWVDSIIQAERPDKVYVDLGAGGGGPALLSILRSRRASYASLLVGVNFGGTSQAKLANPKRPGPKNRRAEMWMRMGEWLGCEEGVQIPDVAELQSDLSAPRRKPSISGDLILESKDDMKARKVRSPDLADALALTFASLEFIPTSAVPAQSSYGSLDTPVASPVFSQNNDLSGLPDAWMA